MLRKLLAAGVVAGVVAVAAGPAAAAETWSLYNHQSAPQFTTSVGAKTFADDVKADTNGEVRVRLHLAGTLQIAPNDITSAVAQNVVQLGDDLFFSGNVPIGALLRLPFLVQTPEEFAKASAALQPYVDKGFAEKGVTVLAGYAYPLQYIWARQEIGSLDALKGMKLRVASPEQSEFVRQFGATPVTISASEVPSALDRGVVDGIVTGSVGADLWKDLLDDGYLMGLNYNNAYYIANAAAFEGLSPELQAGVRKAAETAAAWNTATMQADDKEIIARLAAGEMKIVTPSAEDLAKAAAAMRPYWDRWAQERGPTAVEALAKVREAVGR